MTPEERFEFIEQATPQELAAMLQFMSGWTPLAFDHAVRMVQDSRKARAK